MTQRPLVIAAVVSAILGVASGAAAQQYQFVTVDVPGATSTMLYGVNDRGDVVGRYDVGGVWGGFLLTADGLTTINKPGALHTYTNGINDRGDIVGHYRDASGRLRGFLVRDGVLSPIDAPGALGTRLWDISATGEVAGEYQDATTRAWRGLTWRKDTFGYFDVPGSNMTAGFGINAQGTIVGHFTKPGSGKMFGFIYSDAGVEELNHAASGPNMSCLFGINAQGDAVGHYQDSESGRVFGYRYRNGEFETIAVPGAHHTYPNKISRNGTIVGHFYAHDGTLHGFIATPLNPAGR